MEEERKAEEKGWNERRFFQFNPTPNMPQDAESSLPNLKTNPARYGDEEAPTTEGATPLNPAKEPTASVPAAEDNEPQPEGAPTDSGTIGAPLPPTSGAKSA
jgi:hypothetical protein